MVVFQKGGWVVWRMFPQPPFYETALWSPRDIISLVASVWQRKKKANLGKLRIPRAKVSDPTEIPPIS